MTDIEAKYENVSSILREILNQDIKLPSSASVMQRLQLEVNNVVRQSLSDWQSAYEEAIDPLRYDREELLELYEQIEIDEHVSALIDTIFNNIVANGFQIVDSEGEEDIEAKKLFDKPWFSQFLALSLDTFFHGFNGLQFTGVKDGTFEGVKLIPRKYILPLKGGIRYNSNAWEPNVLFEDRSLYNWTCFLFPQMPADQYKLGRFNKIAKFFILKRENVQFWAMFNEIFGIPFRVMKTDLQDSTRKANAITAMETMTAAAYSIIHDDDDIIFHNGVAASNTGTFSSFIEMANKGMSKALIGSTMVLEDGSSRSQGEVHERNTDAFVISYQRIMAQWINEKIIPRMAALGMAITKEHWFKWDDTETLSKAQTVELISQLNLSGYKVPVEYVMEHTGIPVQEKEVQENPSVVQQDVQNRALFDRLTNMYGKYIGGLAFNKQNKK